MQKKGDVNWVMISLLIGVVALVIIVIMLQQQSSKGVRGYESFRNQTTVGSLSKCDNIILGRSCASTCDPDKGLTQAVGNFECPPGQRCCERA